MNKTVKITSFAIFLGLLMIFSFIRFKKSILPKPELNKPNKESKIKIVTTTGMIKDAIINIAGNYVDIISLMGPNIDPHSYKATPKDLTNLKKADLIFYNGLHLEGKMSDIFKSFSKRKPTFAVGNALDDSEIMRDKEFSEGVDPHIWFDVILWKKVVVYISSILQTKIPEHVEEIKNNTNNYLKELDNLDKFIRSSLEEIAPEQRVLITAHDAFGYFGRAYNVQVKGLQGISTAAEYGLKDVTDLIKFIIERKIKAIFIETSVPEKPIRAVIEGCKNEGHIIILGGPIYSDAMGPEDTPDGNYIGMLKANIRTIVRGLKEGMK